MQFAEINALYRAGDTIKSLASAVAAIKEKTIEPEHIRDIVLLIIQGNHYEYFQDAMKFIDENVSIFEKDIDIQKAYAFAAWVYNDFNRCEASSKKALSLNHEDPGVYSTLGMLYLTHTKYTEAFMALSAGMLFCKDKNGLVPWLKLATLLMKGIHEVHFTFDGLQFTFLLSCFNGQAMESSATHISGTLCEKEELLYIRHELSHCDVILECGSLVGNHTVFFLKALGPKKIIIFDADKESINQTRKNFELNAVGQSSATELILYCKAVGDKKGETLIYSKKFEVTTLDSEIHEKIDFIKIDVDGMELEVLRGAQSIIKTYKPKIMVEVKNTSEVEFYKVLDEIGYTVIRKFIRNTDSNYYITPKN